jgi:peptide deformylase
MIKDILRYPTPLSLQFGVDVRSFDEKLFALIDDLRDTINENNLEGLSAFQIGSPYNVIVVKDEDGNFLELINPMLISYKEKILAEEKSSYYGDISVEIERYDTISLVYQDRQGSDSSLVAKGSLARVIQRKLDYSFGATFLHKLSQKKKEEFLSQLETQKSTKDSKKILFFTLGIISLVSGYFFYIS